MKKLRMYMAAVFVIAAPGAAVAATLTETFTFPTLTGYHFPNAEPGSDLTLFNPALGTLTSATIDLNATAIWSGGGFGDFNVAQYAMYVGAVPRQVLGIFAADSVGPGSGTGSVTFAVPSVDLSFLTGPGTAPTSVLVLNEGDTLANISSSFAPETVTYLYTPAVPEPEMLPVLGGILAVGVCWRRRHRA